VAIRIPNTSIGIDKGGGDSIRKNNHTPVGWTNAVMGSRISVDRDRFSARLGDPDVRPEISLCGRGGCVADDRHHRDRKFLAASRKPDEMSRDNADMNASDGD